ncbi:MAG: 4-hydroxy-tetrahydrodipicolinate reductase [Promethearchaeota archaeon]|nr:MAG: 4-hydroxy-tetrahydrodipicolinate reductase [Candidatus Lokiarchaeota archaeon]
MIFGPTGSMGQLISKLACEDPDIEIVAACDVHKVGEPLANVIGMNLSETIKISDVNDLSNIIKATTPDVAVDFTVAAATEKNTVVCIQNGIRCVIGTTGLSEEFMEKIEGIIKEYNVPAVISSNMATGVNVFFKILSVLSPYLKEWDIEIIEAHHHRKRDAPSGTALTAGHIIAEAIDCEFEEVAKFGREKGPNKREIGATKEIGVHSIRAGDIVGEHIILYGGPGERIEFKHQAHSRDCFASGAIKAIKFIKIQEQIQIYDMRDVLSLK